MSTLPLEHIIRFIIILLSELSDTYFSNILPTLCLCKLHHPSSGLIQFTSTFQTQFEYAQRDADTLFCTNNFSVCETQTIAI